MYSNDQHHLPRPFLSCPDPEAYYPAEAIQQARTTVFRTLDRGEGLALVFGEAGVGKTLLARLLADEFELNAPVLRMTGFRFSDRKAFLSRILYELKKDAFVDGEDVRLQFIDYVRRTDYRRFFLFIDDAERLPLFVFDEIRSLLDLTNGRDVQFRVALFGSSRLEDRLNHPKLTRFCQRITARCWLESFSRQETADYLDARTSAHQTYPFTPEAKKLLHTLADGVPRRVNQIADLALWFGPSAGKQTDALDENVVQKSWNRLEQIPDESNSPQTASGATAAATPVIEFGTLDDEEPAAPAVKSSDLPMEDSVSSENSISDSKEEPITFSSSLPDEEPMLDSQTETAAMDLSSKSNSSNPADEIADEIKEDDAEEFDEADEWEEPGEIDLLREEELQKKLRQLVQSTDIEPPPILDTPLKKEEIYDFPTLKFPNIDSQEEKCKKESELFQTSSTSISLSQPQANYLEELRLLEMEVEQEAKVIRKMREMQAGLTTCHLPNGSSDEKPANGIIPDSDPISSKPSEPASQQNQPQESSKPKRTCPPNIPSRPFRSAFERLFRNDSPEKS